MQEEKERAFKIEGVISEVVTEMAAIEMTEMIEEATEIEEVMKDLKEEISEEIVLKDALIAANKVISQENVQNVKK